MGPIRVRIGIDSGEPGLTDEGYVGLDVHRGARICATAHGGQIVVSGRTRALLDGEFALVDLGLHRLKDLTEPVKLFQLGEREFPPLRSLNATNLPAQPTPLVGRDNELAELSELVRSVRIVTLTGAGGSGKTRLGLQAAAELVHEFNDGVFWVSLAAVNDAELVVPTVAATIGAKGDLAHHVDEKRMLLLLDNLEQILGCASTLAELLRACPNLRLLVTSRAPLRITGEQQYEVPPLAQADAVELFTQLARQVAPAFQPDEHVSEICRRLDGLPLALELAAARAKLLAPAQILERLGRSLNVLTTGARDVPERQRTLRAAIEWSYELLSEEERQLFARTSVFAGSFTLEAAEQVCGAPVDGVAALVDHSLLRQTAGGRLFMLETISEYARERLDQSGDAEARRDSHAEFYLKLAEDAAVRQFEADTQLQALTSLTQERGNLRAALARFEEDGRNDLLLRLAAAPGNSWLMRGELAEGRRWLDAALANQVGGLRTVEQALRYSFWIAVHQGDIERAEKLAAERMRNAETLGDQVRIAGAVSASARVAEMRGDYWQARKLHQQAVELNRGIADDSLIANTLMWLGRTELLCDDYPRARAAFEEAIRLSRTTGHTDVLATSLKGLAETALHEGRFDEAELLYRETVPLWRDLGSEEYLAYAIGGLAAAAVNRGDLARAGRLAGVEEAILASAEQECDPFQDKVRERFHLGPLRDHRADPTIAAAWADGRDLAVDEAIAYALQSAGGPAGSAAREDAEERRTNGPLETERAASVKA
jgi:predicted ATPase